MNDDDDALDAGDPVAASADNDAGTVDHELLADLADDFARRYRRGERPSVGEYADAHPGLSDQIRELFPAMIVMERSVVEAIVSAPSGAEVVGVVVGRYKLLERIGEGGFGVVFMAEQQHPVRRKVALKVLKPGMDTGQVIARFEAERQALAMMDHPNIARVLDAGTTDSGRPYFVMELVHGLPLIEYCELNQLPPRARLELFIQVCDGVQHAHTKGIIHRDLKPTNVLVMTRDDRPVPKVIDFGVAKATGQQLTERTLFTNFAQMLGTPLYMSPEQAQIGGIDVDTRSDVYSLGVMLYELLTGTTPFDKQRLREAALDEVRRIIREEEPPKPSTRLSTAATHVPAVAGGRGSELKRLSGLVRGELDWIVMKAMEKERARRYETANGLARDLQRYLHNETVQACPPSAAYKLRKFASRYRGPVVVTGLLIVALLGGVAGTTRGMMRAKNAESQARDERRRAEHERDAALAANKETFAALIELTDFTDRNLLVDGRVLSQEDQEFLRRMGARYERLAASFPGAADGLELRSRSLAQAGQVYMQLGDAARSLDAWRRAADLHVGSVFADSTVGNDALRAQARRCRSVALAAEKLRRWPEAVEFSRRQVDLASRVLATGERPDVELHNLLVTGNWSLTISLAGLEKYDEARAAWQELLRLVAWSGMGLNAGACEHLGRVAATLAAAGKAADPAATLAPGLAERRRKFAADPAAADVRLELRRGYRALGLVQEKARNFSGALDSFNQVITLTDDAPGTNASQGAEEQTLVLGAIVGRAVCLDAVGRFEEGDRAWEAVCTTTGRAADSWSGIRMVHLAHNGQPERAAQLADATLSQPSGEVRYNAACLYSIASADAGLPTDRKEAFRRRAVSLLDEAKTAGFFNDPVVVAQVRSDADLNAIRARGDFQKLMATLPFTEGK